MSNDWIEHDGGPQPVADDVWVEAYVALQENPNLSAHQARKATFVDWPNVRAYRILNQHLIDAALERGIRLGLEAAAAHLTEGGWIPEIMDLDPNAIARDVQTSSHQEKCDDLHIAREAQDMGSGKET